MKNPRFLNGIHHFGISSLHRQAWLAITAVILTLALIAPRPASAIIDLDTDNLDDVWEEFFGAQALLAGDDDDGDGCTNLEECLAGTDPFDPADCHVITQHDVTGPSTSVQLSFDTRDGKCYQVQVGTSTTGTGGFANVGPLYHGTGIRGRVRTTG